MEPNLTDRVIFSDEATFHVSGRVNRHNTVYWARENPRATRELSRGSPKVNVWCAVTASTIIGPYFFEDRTVNAINYLSMLETFFINSLPEEIAAEGYFQQDGAPAHYARIVRAFLDQQFPNRWIGRSGPFQWPAYSPDLTPCDFWLWGMVKDQVYAEPLGSLEELKVKITQVIRSIPAEMCRAAIEATFNRLHECIEHGGAQVETLM